MNSMVALMKKPASGSKLDIDEKRASNICQMLLSVMQEILKRKDAALWCFEELYRNSYLMVYYGHGDLLYNGLKDVLTIHLRTKVRPDILSSRNGNFLEALNIAYSDHSTSIDIISHFLMYMDRVYVPMKKVSPAYKLGLHLFRDEVIRYGNTYDRLMQSLLDTVMTERLGVMVRIRLKNACEMLVELGVDEPILKWSAKFQRLSDDNTLADGQKLSESLRYALEDVENEYFLAAGID